MKKLLLLAVGAAVVLSSCSNDKEAGNPIDSREICFRTAINKGTDTRTAITNTENILNFTVTGWWDEKGATLAGLDDSQVGKYLFNGYDISRRESDDWSYAPPRYWPEQGKVYFFAYSPAASRGVTAGITDYISPSNTGGATPTLLAYTVPDPSETNAQEDLLLAYTGALSHETVRLNFVHALSRVRFFARTTSPQVNYTIHSVELVNLYKSAQINMDNIPTNGTLTYPIATANTWSGHAAASVTKKNVSVDMAEASLQLTDQFQSLTGVTNGLMVMPQPTTLYAATNNSAPVAGTGAFALKVIYSVYHNGIYYENNTARYFPVKDPLDMAKSLTFEMGRQYNFMLTFGDEVGEAIAFEVEIPQDWNNLTPSANPIHVPNYGTSEYFPDTDFLASVMTLGDTSGDGILSYDELMSIEEYTITSNNNINIDLTGISNLKGLKKVIFTGTINTRSADVGSGNATTKANLAELGAMSSLYQVEFSGAIQNSDISALGNIWLMTFGETSTGNIDMYVSEHFTAVDMLVGVADPQPSDPNTLVVNDQRTTIVSIDGIRAGSNNLYTTPTP